MGAARPRGRGTREDPRPAPRPPCRLAHRGPLRHRVARGLRGDGRRVSRQGRADGRRGRAQAPPARRQPPGDRTIRARGAGPVGASPSGHRRVPRARGGGDRSRPLSGDGVAGRRGPRPAPLARAAAERGGAGPVAACGGGAGGGARAGPGPPGSQAEQPVPSGRAGGSAFAARLRDRAAKLGVAGGHRHRRHRRDTQLHGARAGARRADPPGRRGCLLAGVRAVRVHHRRASLPRRARDGGARQDPLRGAAEAPPGVPGGPGGPRCAALANARQGRRQPLRERVGAPGRARRAR